MDNRTQSVRTIQGLHKQTFLVQHDKVNLILVKKTKCPLFILFVLNVCAKYTFGHTHIHPNDQPRAKNMSYFPRVTAKRSKYITYMREILARTRLDYAKCNPSSTHDLTYNVCLCVHMYKCPLSLAISRYNVYM